MKIVVDALGRIAAVVVVVVVAVVEEGIDVVEGRNAAVERQTVVSEERTAAARGLGPVLARVSSPG